MHPTQSQRACITKKYYEGIIYDAIIVPFSSNTRTTINGLKKEIQKSLLPPSAAVIMKGGGGGGGGRLLHYIMQVRSGLITFKT